MCDSIFVGKKVKMPEIKKRNGTNAKVVRRREIATKKNAETAHQSTVMNCIIGIGAMEIVIFVRLLPFWSVISSILPLISGSPLFR